MKPVTEKQRKIVQEFLEQFQEVPTDEMPPEIEQEFDCEPRSPNSSFSSFNSTDISIAVESENDGESSNSDNSCCSPRYNSNCFRLFDESDQVEPIDLSIQNRKRAHNILTPDPSPIYFNIHINCEKCPEYQEKKKFNNNLEAAQSNDNLN